METKHDSITVYCSIRKPDILDLLFLAKYSNFPKLLFPVHCM